MLCPLLGLTVIGTVTTPATPFEAPTNVRAVPGGASAAISWTAPRLDGGHHITSYTITSAPDDVTGVVDGSTTQAVVEGLTDGNTYTFTVSASNDVGAGPASDPSNEVTIGQAKPPMAPVGVTASAGDGSAAVTWSPPPSEERRPR